MHATCSLPRRAALAAAVATAALVLAACGGNDSTGSADDSPTTASVPAAADRHNDADVTFAEQMIQHHRQAVEMAELADTRASSDDVKALATKIKKAQIPEIDTMSGWLESWGEKVPEGMDGMDGMDHGNSPDMPGMLDDQQMQGLESASGTAFDTAFLTRMIEHHEGAVEMAETEKKQGSYEPAKGLADDVITTQTAEITQMREMLGTS